MVVAPVSGALRVVLLGVLLAAWQPPAVAGTLPGSRPFAARSVWNMPLPPDTRYTAVPGLAGTAVGLSAWLEPDGVSVPVFHASQADRLVAVLHHPDPWSMLARGRWRTAGNPPAVDAVIRREAGPTFPYPFHVYVSQSAHRARLPDDYDPVDAFRRPGVFAVRAPAEARPTRGADGHLVIVQPDGRVFEAYGAIVLADGSIVAQSFKLTDPGLAGDGFQNGVTASMVPVYAGLILTPELAAGRIEHAIKLLAPARLLSPACVYPALTFDRRATGEVPGYSGSLPMGARLALPPGLDATALGLRTPIGRMVAAAAQTYGMIVVDRGGEGLTLVTEAGSAPGLAWTPAAQDDLDRIVAALRRAEPPPGLYATSRELQTGRAQASGQEPGCATARTGQKAD